MKTLIFSCFLLSVFLYFSCSSEKILQSYKPGDEYFINDSTHLTIISKSDWRNRYLVVDDDGDTSLLPVEVLDSLIDR